MRITVLGCGTSTGVPVIGCRCPVCQSGMPENNRLRCSLYVESAHTKILVDCSIDFRQQALRYHIPHIDAVLFTHNHADHMNGIDDLRVYNHMQQAPIDLFGTADMLASIRTRFDYCFNPPQQGGGVPQLNLREIHPGDQFHVRDILVLPIRIKHGKLDIVGFRIGRHFAYLTDCSHVPTESLPLIEGIKILVVDALRKRHHPTHFSLDEAVAFSRQVNPEMTWFTHMADELDYFETNAQLPSDMQLLKDGQIIDIDD